MYVESNKKEINWGNVIKKGILIILGILVIIFIIWLFNRGNSNKINVNNGNNSNNSTINESFYSNDFIDNYRYFHDTAKEYFLISELPQNGQTLKYTLKELIDRGLILPFGYQGKTCDFEASYALVTNVNGEYKLTITLVCGTEVAKTTEELGCNQLCTGGSCQNTPSTPEEPDEELVTEYEYRQPYTTSEKVYTCPSGYTKATQNGQVVCIKTDSTSTKATKVVTYYCPTGYDKSGEGANTKCTSKEDKVVNAEQVVDYVCENKDYVKVGEGENTKCYKKTTDTVPAKSYPVYSCPSGYKSSGTGVNMKCSRTVTIETPAIPVPTSCPTGWQENGNICSKIVDAIPQCNNGYSYDASLKACVKVVPPTAIPYTTYNCNGIGGSLVGNVCRTTEIVDLPRYQDMPNCQYLGVFQSPTCSSKNCNVNVHRFSCPVDTPANQVTNYNYVCPSNTVKSSGYGINTTCTIKDNNQLTYTCTEGQPYGVGKCLITSTKASASVCPDGFNPKADGQQGMCYKDVTDTTNPVVSDTKYYCENSNYHLDGKTCYKTTEDTQPATKKVTYKCSEGKLDGTKCILEKGTTNAIKNTEYTCPSGFTKYNIGASSTCVKKTTGTANPTVSTQNVTKYKYQWSAETSLPGWERTGKTRQSKVSSK